MLPFAAFALAATISGPVLAPSSPWNGTWTGTTERGGSVQIVVSGNTPTAYIFRGQPAAISSPKASANALSFKVGTTGTVTLTKAGAGARYSYSDTTGGNAAATLTRQ
jgi:hypothetical protein